MQFINRTRELHTLQQLWDQQKNQLVVVYGKRRVGKTELIKQFIADGKGIYYLADKRTQQEQLAEFARVVGNWFEDTFVIKKGFDDWLEAFSYLKQALKGKPLVVALDEYPYLLESDTATSSLFQKICDEIIADSAIYLIICGSSIAMMESEVLSEKAPLYGRKTGLLLVEPMDYQASRQFFPDASFVDFMRFYSITGGMPAYMQQFTRFSSITEAIEALCWNKQGLYHHELTLALKQELRSPAIYFAVLKAIAWGKTKVGDIAQSVGLESPIVNKYIDTLIQLQFIRREVPVTEQKPYKSRKGLYCLTEHFVRFWFQYVYAYASDLEIDTYTYAEKHFNSYGNRLESIAYEEIARSHLKRYALHSKKLFPFDRIGRYWDATVEIDGIGFNEDQRKIVFMEAKWSNTKIDLRTLNKLRQKSKSVDWHQSNRQDFFALYSKAGFTPDVLEYAAQKKNIVLVHQDTVIK